MIRSRVTPSTFFTAARAPTAAPDSTSTTATRKKVTKHSPDFCFPGKHSRQNWLDVFFLPWAKRKRVIQNPHLHWPERSVRIKAWTQWCQHWNARKEFLWLVVAASIHPTAGADVEVVWRPSEPVWQEAFFFVSPDERKKRFREEKNGWEYFLRVFKNNFAFKTSSERLVAHWLFLFDLIFGCFVR